ncbi:hypothetical protein Bhyg_14213 [Pseudolycoriella hygida]|uniref:Uncharacterized protein n=1 Tax=Pseudolycoriella hygida TaxID=35572 RepID=A0A9Q0MPH9_9DIPT|nr:hypothetical protein Bhyg_14213 [Pseudolycoriella hygida]
MIAITRLCLNTFQSAKPFKRVDVQ